jgi:hypothetical protein
MEIEYKVKAFVPKIAGCGGKDNGWDEVRCAQYSEFLNEHAQHGWKLHSSEYRTVKSKNSGLRR